jgi:hypothetical protein
MGNTEVVGTHCCRIRQQIFSTQGKIAIYVLRLYRSDRHTVSIEDLADTSGLVSMTSAAITTSHRSI